MHAQSQAVDCSPSFEPCDDERQCNEALAEFLARSLELKCPPRLPVEIIEKIVASSAVKTLKVWTLVCKTLLPLARCQLFKKAPVHVKSNDDAHLLIESFSLPSPLPTAARYIRWIKLSGEYIGKEVAEVWQVEAIRSLQSKELVLLDRLTVDMRFTAIGTQIFRWLVEECRLQRQIPLPNVRHVELIGPPTIPAYRVMEIVSLFPRLEVLKFRGFRWDTFSMLYYIPFPPFLQVIEAIMPKPVVNAGVALVIMFDASKERRRRRIPHFALHVICDDDETTDRAAGRSSDPDPEGWAPVARTLKALDRVVPTVENLDIRIPMAGSCSSEGLREFLLKNGFVKELQSLHVNGERIL